MAAYVVNLIPSVIISGSSVGSSVIDFDDASALGVFSPVVLTNVCTLEVARTTESTALFRTLESGGSVVTVQAGRHMTINKVTFRQIRVVSAGAEGQADTFEFTKECNV